VTSATGNTIGKYRLIAELGHGGMADVSLAVAQGLGGFNKLLVLKQLRHALVGEPEFVTMFLDEARLAARLNHPNVVHTHEVGQDGERYYMAMEYLDGQPLHRVLRRSESRGGMPLPLFVQILVRALEGLHYAHELRDYDGTPLCVVHRDLTPHNMFVTYAGEVKIVDFGIAKTLDSHSETKQGVLRGKIGYISPEQARSENVDRRADIFSAGVMLWEAAAGRRFWQGLDGIAIIHKLLGGELPSIDVVAPHAPERIRRIINRALAHSATDRFATAQDLQTSLEAWLSDTSGHYSPRELGDHVAELFLDERTRIAGVIEDRLRNIQSLPEAGNSDVELLRLNFNSLASIPSDHPPPQAPTVTAESSAGLAGSQHTPTGTALVRNPVSLAPAASRTRRSTVIAIGALAVLMTAGAAGLYHAQRPQLPPPEAAPVAAASVSAPAPAPAAISVERPEVILFIARATPANARIFVDNEPLSSNPYEGLWRRDEARHVIRAEAPGYSAASVELVFDKEVRIELALQRPEPAAATPTPREKNKPVPAATTAPSPPDDLSELPPTKRTRRPIDTESPWK